MTAVSELPRPRIHRRAPSRESNREPGAVSVQAAAAPAIPGRSRAASSYAAPVIPAPAQAPGRHTTRTWRRVVGALKPRESSFYASLATAAHAAVAATVALADGLGASADRAATVERLAELDRIADAEYSSTLRSLHRSFVTPFDRGQIQALAHVLTQATQRTHAAGSLIHLLDPPPAPPELQAVTALLGDAATATERAVGGLRRLIGLDDYHATMRHLVAEAESHRRVLVVRLASGYGGRSWAIGLQAVSVEVSAALGAFRDAAEIVQTVAIAEG